MKYKKISSKLFLYLTVIILLINLCSCSRYIYKSAYNNLDFLLLNKIEDYIELRSDQKEFLKKRLIEHHKWHRQKELPRIVDLLNYTKSMIQNGVTQKKIRSISSQFRRQRSRIVKRLIKDTSKFLSTLDAQQINNLEKKLAESNKGYEKKAKMTSEKRFNKRYEASLKYIKLFTNDLKEKQEKQIFNLVKLFPDLDSGRLEYRKKFQKTFINLLRANYKADKLEVKINNLFSNNMYRIHPNYNRKMGQWNSSLIKFIIELEKIITPEQKVTVIKNISNWANDFKDLSQVK